MERLTLTFKKYIKQELILAALIGIGFILITLALGSYSNLVIPPNTDINARYLAEPGTHLDFMSEWDGPHYLEIAQHGYIPNQKLTAFFPLYPLLIRLVLFVVNSPIISALIVSWACLIGAIYFYLKILKTLFNSDINNKVMGVLLFIMFPTGVFLAATYTEALFAFGALAALYFALKGKYLWSGLFTAVATATHPTGVFILPLIALVLWEKKIKISKITASVALGCIGIVGYMSYLWYSRGNPLAFVNSQEHNHWLSSHYFSTIASSITAIDVILLILVIVSVIYWWKKKLSFAIYSLIFALLPFIGGNFAGYSRYVLMAFPLQFMLYSKTKRSNLAYSLVLALFTIGWAYFVIHYAAGYTGGS